MKIRQLFESEFEDLVILTEGTNYGEMFNSIRKYIERIEQVGKLIIDDDDEGALNVIFKNMVEDLYTALDSKTLSMVSDAKELSPRQDIRIWFMRVVKPYAIYRIEGILTDAMLTSFPQYNPYLFYTELRKIKTEMTQEEQELRIQYIGSDFDYPLYEIKNNLTHWLNTQIPAIQEFEFRKEHTYEEVLERFRAYEEEWLQSVGGKDSRRVPEKGHKIIDFGDGYAWWDLEDTWCPEEGKAAGHCGNAPYKDDPNQKALSLRKETGVAGVYEPALFFVYHIKEKGLGERKGVGNSRPHSSYHKYIEALIMEPFIEQFLDERSYLPENDFQITDLPNWKQIWEQKPGLLSFDQYVETIGVDDYIMSKIKFFDSSYNDIEEIDNRTLRFQHKMASNFSYYDYVTRFADDLSRNVTYNIHELSFLVHLTAALYMYDYDTLYDSVFDFLSNTNTGHNDAYVSNDIPQQTMQGISKTLSSVFEDLLMDVITTSQGMEGRVHVWSHNGRSFLPIGETHFPATMDNPSTISIMVDKNEILSLINEYSRMLQPEYALSIVEVRFDIDRNFGFAMLFDKNTGDIDGIFGQGWADRVTSIDDPVDFLMNDPLVSKYFQRFIPQMKNVIETYYNNLGFELPQ